MIIVFGSTGRLGSEMVSTLREVGYPVFSAPRSVINLENVWDAKALIANKKPSYVINCSAYNGLEACAANPDKAFHINSVVPGQLAESCNQIKATFIHFSTDYVFSHQSSGTGTDESHFVTPWGMYGKTKELGEQTSFMFNHKTYVFRLSSIYGRAFSGSTDAVKQAREGKGTITNPVMVLHQFCTPTSTKLVSDAVLHAINVEVPHYGIYHLAAKGAVWKKDFSEYLLRRCGFPHAIVKEGTLAIARPVYSVFNTDKFQKTFDYELPSWEDDINQMLPYMQ